MPVRRTLPTLTVALATAALAAPAIADSHARTLIAQSRTATGVTGDVILSDTRIAFGNGATADIALDDDAATGPFDFTNDGTVTARIYRVTSDPGPLLRDNTLCQGAPTWLVSYDDPDPAGGVVLMFFDGADRPTAAATDDLCGAYVYDNPD